MQTPAHFWPIALVAAAADLWSVTAPEGVTRQLVVEADSASPMLDIIVLNLPIPPLFDEVTLYLGHPIEVVQAEGNHIVVRRSRHEAPPEDQQATRQDDILAQPVELLGIEPLDDPLG